MCYPSETQCLAHDYSTHSVMKTFICSLKLIFLLVHSQMRDVEAISLFAHQNKKKYAIYAWFISFAHPFTQAIYSRIRLLFLPSYSCIHPFSHSETSLKFCVAQRNFLVGATIIDNIMRAIYNSRRVILFISPNFLRSGWCKEELLIAHNVSALLSIIQYYIV